MGEYIEREAIKYELWSVGPLNEPLMVVRKKTIDRIPAADVTPVRHGRWVCISKGYEEYECSVCRGVDSNCSDCYRTHVVTEQEYCPNCGAKMDRGDD